MSRSTSLASRRALRAPRARIAWALALAFGAAAPAATAAQGAPAIPAAPAGAGIAGAPPPPPAASGLSPSSGARAEGCRGCHALLLRGRVVHGAVEKHDCAACHRPAAGPGGKCRSSTASKWALARAEPDLCYGCHGRKDRRKSVHSAVAQGSCLACHAAHASDLPALLTEAPEKICFGCHELGALLAKPVKHAPVAEGRCLGCHDPHGGDVPNNLRKETGRAACLKCHDAKAPRGKGTPGARFRVDLSRKVVHEALGVADCTGCHLAGHGSDALKLLRKPPPSLCYECHDRKDGRKYTHGAVTLGDCAVCHDPHSSDAPKLLAKATLAQTCFTCHEDDLTGRKVIHPALEAGCDTCHDPHGADSRHGLKIGEGKAACYSCHEAVDRGKVKHAALERYGCTGCHDPHGSNHGAMLGKQVNELCATCHEAQRDGKHVTTLLGKGHVVGGALRDPRREGKAFSCASCHDPHGSNSPKLFYSGDGAMSSCDGCHGDKSGKHPELKNVIPRARKEAPAAPAGAAGSAAGSAGGSAEVGVPVAGGGGERR